MAPRDKAIISIKLASKKNEGKEKKRKKEFDI